MVFLILRLHQGWCTLRSHHGEESFMPPRRLRGAAYARLSLVRKGHVETATDRQTADAHIIAERENVDIVLELVDSGRSAFTGKERESFEAVIAALENREIDVLIAWKFDRLTRNLDDYARLERALKGAGAHLITGDGVDTRQGWLLADMLFGMARNESANISIRVKRVRQEMADNGRPHGGKRPFGYDRDRHGSGLVPNPVEAEFLREAASRLLIGDSLSALCRDAAERGILGTTGRPLSRTALRAALTAARTAGLRVHHGVIHREGAWDPILDEQTWTRVGRMLSHPSRRQPSRGRTFPLLGLLRCECGHALSSCSYPDKSRAYRCEKRRGGCGRVNVKADPLEQVIREMTFEKLSQPKVRAHLENTQSETDTAAATLLGHIEELRHSMDQLSNDHYVKRIVPRNVFEQTMEQLNNESQKAHQDLQRLTGQKRLGMIPQELAELEKTWDTGPAEARALASQVFEFIVVKRAPKPGQRFLNLDRIAPVLRGRPQ